MRTLRLAALLLLAGVVGGITSTALSTARAQPKPEQDYYCTAQLPGCLSIPGQGQPLGQTDNPTPQPHYCESCGALIQAQQVRALAQRLAAELAPQAGLYTKKGALYVYATDGQLSAAIPIQPMPDDPAVFLADAVPVSVPLVVTGGGQVVPQSSLAGLAPQ